MTAPKTMSNPPTVGEGPEALGSSAKAPIPTERADGLVVADPGFPVIDPAAPELVQGAQCLAMAIREVEGWADNLSLFTAHCHAAVLAQDLPAMIAATQQPAGEGEKGLYEQIGSVRVGKGDLLDHLLVSLSEDEATAAIEEIACLVRRPLTRNVLDLVQFVSWALEEGQPINDEHIIALLDAIKDTRNPALSATQQPAGEGVDALTTLIDECEMRRVTTRGLVKDARQQLAALSATQQPVCEGVDDALDAACCNLINGWQDPYEPREQWEAEAGRNVANLRAAWLAARIAPSPIGEEKGAWTCPLDGERCPDNCDSDDRRHCATLAYPEPDQ